MKETKVYLLDVGTMVLDRTYLYLDAGLSGDERFPVYGVLVDHADGKFLFDTGFDMEHTCTVAVATKPLQSARQTLQAQLDLLSMKPKDITHVINSHYHIDHIGGNKLCTHATSVCHKCELESYNHPADAEKLGYSDRSCALDELPVSAAVEDAAAKKAESIAKIKAGEIDIFTPRFETLTGDQEIAKGVFLFETLGHTAGHYSLMVKLANRKPMLFTADACYSQKNLDMMCIQAGNHNPEQTRASMQRLKNLSAQHDAELFFSHDQISFDRYQKAPLYYV